MDWPNSSSERLTAADRRQFRAFLPTTSWQRQSLAGIADPAASLVCLFGLLLQFVLSAPLLDALGFNYSLPVGAPWEKLHPGTHFILISFVMLLTTGGKPLDRLISIIATCPTFSVVLLINLLVSFWATTRSGLSGLGTTIETCVAPPLVAIVLSFAPRGQCRRAVLSFVALVSLNSAIGIGEALLQKRLFKFRPEWAVLHQSNFRASALLGHPLDNAMMTSVAIFILLSSRLPAALKTVLALLFFAALVAFGGRMALGTSVIVFLGWGAARMFSLVRSRRLKLLHLFLIGIGAFIVPAVLLGSIDVLVHSAIGTRLEASSLSDKSVAARFVALDTLRHLRPEELWFGISLQREIDLEKSMSSNLGDDIENAWILMLFYFGIVGFAVWLLGFLLFVARLLKGAPPGVQLALLACLAEASTSNSFGRKGSVLSMVVGTVVCASVAYARPVRLPRPPKGPARLFAKPGIREHA